MIIPFLRSLYHPQDAVLDSDLADHNLFSEIRRHSIGAQVYHLLKSPAGTQVKVSPAFQELLYRSYESSFLQNLLIKRETDQLLTEFDKSGIPVIPLKGTLLAERYYGHYAARGTSDIDLLIRPEHMEAAVECVRKLGFNETIQDNPVHYHHEWYKETGGLPEPLIVELHWSLIQMNTSQINMAVAWETSEPLSDYKNVRVLSPSYTFYALCLHGASHQMDSLKYVVDVVHFLVKHQTLINVDWLLKQAHQDHTSSRVAAALTVVKQLFPNLGFIDRIPFKPIRIFNQKSRFYSLLFTLSMLDSWRYRSIYMARLIIPSRSVALYSLDTDQRHDSRILIYYNLYKQRLRKFIRGLNEGA